MGSMCGLKTAEISMPCASRGIDGSFQGSELSRMANARILSTNQRHQSPPIGRKLDSEAWRQSGSHVLQLWRKRSSSSNH